MFMNTKLLLLFLFLIPFSLSAQNERKLIREGVKQYRDSSYTGAEISFRNALSKDSTSLEAAYDVAGSLYKQDKYEDAETIYQELTDRVKSPKELADTWHNLGNSLFQKEDYEKSIEAYKNSLRIRPNDQETKYNLAYAQSMLKKQEQEQQNDQDKKDDNKDNKDQQDKDKNDQDQNKDKQDENNKEENNKDQQDDQENEQEKPEPRESQKEGMNKEDMERMLQAIEQQEKELIQKIEKEKAKAPKVKTEKNW